MLCYEVSKVFTNSVFFAGQLVFNEEMDGFFSRFLHNHTALDLLKRLQLRGLSLVILPVRASLRGPVSGPTTHMEEEQATQYAG